ncbi:NAD-dependent epimerase/dehydratase family protein [Patescibacteria group bacterium]|nr:NAD-dependent epimerase/dehydratase family protein [Patescibacteria group bacterium]
MKAVVTGGAGFIGSHLADALLKEGYETHVVDNLWGGHKEDVPLDAIFHEKDILDTDAMREIFRDADVVFHEAARPRIPYSIDYPEESHEANVNGTLSVLLAARDAKVRRVVYASSSSCYGDQNTLPLVETMAARPMNPYALQKYMAEEYTRVFSEVYGLTTVSLRYFSVYGPRMRPDGGYALAIPKFLALRKNNEVLPITGDGTQTRDFTHIRDVVRANLLAATSENVGKGEVINIAAGRNVSMNQLADLIGGEKTYIPSRPEARDTLGDISKAKELLGWAPTVSLEEGIAELTNELHIS